MLKFLTKRKGWPELIKLAGILEVPIIHTANELTKNDAVITLDRGAKIPPGKACFNNTTFFGVKEDKTRLFQALVQNGLPVLIEVHELGAMQYYLDKGEHIFCKTKDGTKVIRKESQIPKHQDEVIHATLGMSCKREYRALYFFGSICGLEAKVKVKRDHLKYIRGEQLVKSEDNGYSFQEDAVKIPVKIKDRINEWVRVAARTFDLQVVQVHIIRDKSDNMRIAGMDIGDCLKEKDIPRYIQAINHYFGA